jgi:hypothetical protein
VPGVLDQPELARRNPFGHVESCLGRAGGVVAGPDDQRQRGDRRKLGVGHQVSPADLRILEAQDVPHGLGEPVSAVDAATDRDEFVGHRSGIRHQPLQARPDALRARVVGRRLAQRADALHHFRRRHRAAGGVQHQPLHAAGKPGGELDRDPAAE